MQARGRLCEPARETRSLTWRACRGTPTCTCSCRSWKFVNYRRENGGHVANIPFESRSERGILISFCDSFRVESTFSFPYGDHMYDLCYVIFMSRREVTKREITK